MKRIVLAEEPFYSIQGEGLNVGAPSVFVRTANCNLKCSWCDTKFARLKDEPRFEYTELELLNEVTAFDCDRLVLTGGEPTIQWNNISDSMKRLDYYGFKIELETNGTKFVDFNFNVVHVSLKLRNSGNSEKLRLVPKEIKKWVDYGAYFKFVVDNVQDMHEVNAIIARYGIKPSKVFLMPLGATRQEQIKSSIRVIEWCKLYGYSFSPRLHIFVWGKKRGV